MKLKTGLDGLQGVTVDDVRGVPFCGMGAFVGTGKAQRAHAYSAKLPVDPDTCTYQGCGYGADTSANFIP